MKDKSFKVHPNLPDLQEFSVVECLLLYLVSYPALAMYRSISGNLIGLLTLSIILAGLLLFLTGPMLVQYRQDQDEKEKISTTTPQLGVHTGSDSNNDSFIEVNEDEYDNDNKDNTPTTANNNKQRGTAFDDNNSSPPILGEDSPPLPPPVDTDPECDKHP